MFGLCRLVQEPVIQWCTANAGMTLRQHRGHHHLSTLCRPTFEILFSQGSFWIQNFVMYCSVHKPLVQVVVIL